MAGATASCPSCGATIEFKIGASMAVVCSHCKSVVVRSDRGVENLGRVADVVGTDGGLAVNDRGSFRGRHFEVAGRLVLQHPQGGTWEEYYVHFDGRDTGWIAEAQGQWSVVVQVPAQAPPYQSLRVGYPASLGSFGNYVVGEVSQGTFMSAEGELPFAARPGSVRAFADLSGQAGACASIDYGDGSRAPLVYVGTMATLGDLGVQRVGAAAGGTAGQTIKSRETRCPSCGAPLPLRAAGATSRIACTYCGALSDLETNQVLAQQDVARAQPWIPLGSKGTLENIAWTVIGYVERYCTIDDEQFEWQEYLLYEENAGFRWLVVDEGVCRFGQSIGVGDIDTRGLPHTVGARGMTFRRRNENTATVSRVLGEFYWKVQIGEAVLAADYENRAWMISSETSSTEVNWTISQVVPTNVIVQAFGIQDRAAPNVPDTVEEDAPLGSATNWNGLVTAIVIIVVFLIMARECASSCNDGSGSGGTYSSGGIRSGSGGGGFGGK
ncbi:MAG TPA: DUF4178 domain-containing protein [Polyangiaceae bacterium]|jgi:DNA-directed RNA polymerase subunit RPC12/RpoP